MSLSLVRVRRKPMNLFKNIMFAGALLVLTDFAGWLAWALSGQMPADGFYWGAITSHIISLFAH